MTDTKEILFKTTKLMVSTFLLAHWLACIYWVAGMSQVGKHEDSWVKN